MKQKLHEITIKINGVITLITVLPFSVAILKLSSGGNVIRVNSK